MTFETIWENRIPNKHLINKALTYKSLAKAGGSYDLLDFAYGSKRLSLFSNVRLIRELHAEGEILKQGASGTIVERLEGGNAYIVEFFQPRHCVVTVYDFALVAEGK